LFQRRNYAEGTTRYYIRAAQQFAQHFGKSPDKLGPSELRSYQAYLLKERKLTSVFNDMHVYTAETDSKARGKWLNSLQKIRELKPSVVIPGHSKVGAPLDASTAVDFTGNYLLAFEKELKSQTSGQRYQHHEGKIPSRRPPVGNLTGAKVNVKP
jgi:hypothetical protein